MTTDRFLMLQWMGLTWIPIWAVVTELRLPKQRHTLGRKYISLEGYTEDDIGELGGGRYVYEEMTWVVP